MIDGITNRDSDRFVSTGISIPEDNIETVKEPSPLIICLSKKITQMDDYLLFEGKCLTKFLRSDEEMDLNRLWIQFGRSPRQKINFDREKGRSFIKGYQLNAFKVKLPIDDLLNGRNQRKLHVIYKGKFVGRFLFNAVDYRRGRGRKTRTFYSDERAIWLRQSIKNTVYITTSRINIPLIINIKNKVTQNNSEIVLSSWCFTKLLRGKGIILDTKDLLLEYGAEEPVPIEFKYRFGIPFIKKYRLNKYQVRIPKKNLFSLDIQNRLQPLYQEIYRGRVMFRALDYLTGRNRNTEVVFHDDMAVYFRQTVKNTTYMTVREANYFDYPEGRKKVLWAFLLSKILPHRNIMLLYEKECGKYEESASILFEKLIDKGYKNAYFILNDDNKALADMDERYKANIIEKHSFKHILYFFLCKKFIGTEVIAHSIQLRAANKHIVDKINSRNLKYVFLQHGVMYMVSLDAELRGGFREKDLQLYRVVVSSQLEAEHFIELGGFKEEELYITGLAKFDRSYKYDDADKIVIMPTWRRWESNLAREDFTQTKYYKMIERIADKVPENLKDKIVILPHPLMQKSLGNQHISLEKYLNHDLTHDEVLRKCKLLITDYSSIAYDAFYRGSNVIFYWEEKDECMDNYGGRAHLMLNDRNAFGDICYNDSNLSDIINKNYYGEQTVEHYDNFKQIVSFDDNRNTERIIEKLIDDGIIKNRPF